MRSNRHLYFKSNQKKGLTKNRETEYLIETALIRAQIHLCDIV
jgi:hypothetical protein